MNAEHDFVGALGASAILDSDCPMNCSMNGIIWIDHTEQCFGRRHHTQQTALVSSSDILGLWVPELWVPVCWPTLLHIP